jgi:hypothetical protein
MHFSPVLKVQKSALRGLTDFSYVTRLGERGGGEGGSCAPSVHLACAKDTLADTVGEGGDEGKSHDSHLRRRV